MKIVKSHVDNVIKWHMGEEGGRLKSVKKVSRIFWMAP